MNNDMQNQTNFFLAALVGGLAGGLVVYFSNETRRKKIIDKFEEFIMERKKDGADIKDAIGASIQKGRKNLVKKIHQVEDEIAQG